jgi:hypothetical protein
MNRYMLDMIDTLACPYSCGVPVHPSLDPPQHIVFVRIHDNDILPNTLTLGGPMSA